MLHIQGVGGCGSESVLEAIEEEVCSDKDSPTLELPSIPKCPQSSVHGRSPDTFALCHTSQPERLTQWSESTQAPTPNLRCNTTYSVITFNPGSHISSFHFLQLQASRPIYLRTSHGHNLQDRYNLQEAASARDFPCCWT